MKIFVRERRRSDRGNQRPRYRVVGVQGGDLKIYVKRIRKCELEEIAENTGAEVVYLPRDGEGKGGGKTE
ncbi:MAG: hypothetical protein H0S80_11385 [Desulfovibrionaceae bacterium]|nr:hypothetical protein [Desulfovibrionaceae bacterium]